MGMNNKIESISAKIINLNEIITSFTDYDEIPLIDIDLLKSKLRDVYEDVDSINKITETTKVIIETVEDEVVVEQAVVNEAEGEFVNELPTESDLKKEDERIDEELVELLDKADAQIAEKEELISEDMLEVFDAEQQFDEPVESVLQADSGGNSEVNSIISEFEQSNDLASKLQFKPIDDINNAVSINDKIGFINDIFDGNSDSYVACISKLNNASDLSNAVNILDSSRSWDKANEVHKKFIELVFRKFV